MRRKPILPIEPVQDQQHLPGEEFAPPKPPPYAPELEDAARNYFAAVRRRLAEAADEKETYDRLAACMEFHAVKSYSFNGVTIEPAAKPKWKVKVDAEPFTESDPNQLAIDGTVHADDESEPSELKEDLTAMAARIQDDLSDSGDAA